MGNAFRESSKRIFGVIIERFISELVYLNYRRNNLKNIKMVFISVIMKKELGNRKYED